MAYPRDHSPPTLAVLHALLHTYPDWTYGYDLTKTTSLKSGTLYPLLKRLHDRDLLEARWEASLIPGRPPRHAYRLTEHGRSFAQQRLTHPQPTTADLLT